MGEDRYAPHVRSPPLGARDERHPRMVCVLPVLPHVVRLLLTLREPESRTAVLHADLLCHARGLRQRGGGVALELEKETVGFGVRVRRCTYNTLDVWLTEYIEDVPNLFVAAMKVSSTSSTHSGGDVKRAQGMEVMYLRMPAAIPERRIWIEASTAALTSGNWTLATVVGSSGASRRVTGMPIEYEHGSQED
jgi:hypothetical protein